ncbi:hypothetical protein K8R43_05130 [archaeon]|nr:hypothetical protein [archaeon]
MQQKENALARYRIKQNYLNRCFILLLSDKMGMFDFLKGETEEQKMKIKREERQQKMEMQKKLIENKGKPLKILIQDTYEITGIGLVAVGRVESGIAEIGQQVVVRPSGATGEIKTIEANHQKLQQAAPGTSIGFSISGINKSQIGKGSIVEILE